MLIHYRSLGLPVSIHLPEELSYFYQNFDAFAYNQQYNYNEERKKNSRDRDNKNV